ncbi:hypothetical protein FEM03_13060 [Phragmitibacter flavus]|uniref:Type II secretion system protein GspG C-terminal domain-containing protein n=2 Tax=Phragmitibacter flavus TaxID=2576071 RepID=A0A5R8KDE2_9BACT|nr:hypothetical protein FEM03_13060 [Phragmitibacter flavus]
MKSEPLAPVVMHDAAAEMSNMLANPERNPEERIQAVREVLYLFRQGFGDNPPGHNEMVVSALIGENNKRTALLPKDSPAIKDGALVDAWGTPYWFHALSAKQMEIRSAGPDKELFTQDDLVVE